MSVLKYFYRDSVSDLYIVDGVIVSPGLYTANFYDTDTKIELVSVSTDKVILESTEITNLLKENGDPYTDKDELLTALSSFFFISDLLLAARVETLENKILKVYYYEPITTVSGQIIPPTGATILLDQWATGEDALVCTIVNGKPSFEVSTTIVDSFDVAGNYTLSGALPSNPAAFIYVFKLSRLNFDLYVDIDYIIQFVELDTAAYEPSIPLGGVNSVWHGNKVFSPVVEADITLANNTTNNATVSKHGFLPILSGNGLQYLDGAGSYSTPTAGIANSYKLTSFTAQTSVNVVHAFGTSPTVDVLEFVSGTTYKKIIPLEVTENSLNDFTVTFSAATTGKIVTSVGSPQPNDVKVVTGNYTITTSDSIIKATGAGSIISFPDATINTGFIWSVDNASGGDITVDCVVGGQLIQGNTTQLITNGSCMSVYCDGTGFRFY